ncbi:hypothetical protein BON30_48945 [Cystobacter ferrugineus]|uniref:Uncharacterized protein n=1 Tax=Cystobacter ferrugineus TaxID=83449 RepID=A0A1L9ATS6_9BACT|nr:hypothetical protein BON30_48945 [Cystobacter ferrugineus]
MSEGRSCEGNWKARLYERVRERGYDSLTAFAEARPATSLMALADELGPEDIAGWGSTRATPPAALLGRTRHPVPAQEAHGPRVRPKPSTPCGPRMRRTPTRQGSRRDVRAAGAYRAWLWVVASALVVVFHIATSRGGKVTRQLLGSDFAGFLMAVWFDFL